MTETIGVMALTLGTVSLLRNSVFGTSATIAAVMVALLPLVLSVTSGRPRWHVLVKGSFHLLTLVNCIAAFIGTISSTGTALSAFMASFLLGLRDLVGPGSSSEGPTDADVGGGVLDRLLLLAALYTLGSIAT